MSLDDDLRAFREATEPGAAMLARLQAGPPPPRRWPWRVVALGVAAGLLLVALRALAPGDVLVEQPLEHGTTAALGPYVEVRASGQGSARGGARELALEWRTGQLDVSVRPHEGVHLRVTTEEAAITVIGTRFTVDRGPLGTTVGVQAGAVSVACVAGDARTLGPGEQIECAPISIAGRLRRIAHLQARGRAQDVVQEATDALDPAPPADIALELELHRVAAWIALGQQDLARSTLERLSSEHPGASARLEGARALLDDP